eukprot:symbB.v1.2.032454.t1/scaffold3899.1/size48661/4
MTEGLGELCLAGPMVTTGYWNPQKSELPWVEVNGIRLFRTGDVVFLAKKGGFSYRGRKDRTTKVQGQWLELRPLEESLQDLEGIREACIIEDGGSLYAFLVPECHRATDLLRCMEIFKRVRQMLPWQLGWDILHLSPATWQVPYRHQTARACGLPVDNMAPWLSLPFCWQCVESP